MKVFPIIFLIVLSLNSPAQSANSDDASAVIFRAMKEEMKRSLNDLKIESFPAPYFINYQIRHNHRVEVSASLGALLDSIATEKRTLFVDVRVGNPKFDSSMVGSHKHKVKQLIPLDNEILSLKRALWYETDLRYKQAVINLLRKKGKFVSGVQKHEWPDFTKADSTVVQLEEVPAISIDIQKWKNLTRKVSARFLETPEIERSKVKIVFDRTIRYYFDSEGNQIQQANQLYRIILDAWGKNTAGVQIHDQDSTFFIKSDRFPSTRELMLKVKQLMKNMTNLKNAPKGEPYVGPAIFSPEATAILFHEALGHRLEGDRLRNTHDGKTFFYKIGKRILPSFITVVDDPALDSFRGQDLIGHYKHDDQGQTGEKVLLVDKGVLKNFLLSRAPLLEFNKSNGHARSDGEKNPMSRMSSFIVSSDKQIPLDRLKQRLIEEIKRQKKPYGLLIHKMISGETLTDSRDFQIFRGRPLYVYKIYPEDGRKEFVRGVEFLGTPISIVNKIITTGDDMKVVNGICNAESGNIPVTTIAPSILLSEVELQAAHDISIRLPILPPPTFKPVGAKTTPASKADPRM